jgi:tetratricopeptide (TPR) repeat protein
MNHEEKIERLRQLAESDPDDALTFFLLGRELMEVGQYEQAVQALERTVMLNGQYTAAFRFLGDCYRLAGDHPQARTTYRKGIEVAESTGDLQAGKEMLVFLKKLGN